MKTCKKCNISYPDESKYCKNCGSELLSEQSGNAENNNIRYLSILALLLPMMEILYRINIKILISVNGLYGVPAKISVTIINLISLALPVLIVIKMKNSALKIATIILCAILFILHVLANFDIYNWDKWFYS